MASNKRPSIVPVRVARPESNLPTSADSNFRVLIRLPNLTQAAPRESLAGRLTAFAQRSERNLKLPQVSLGDLLAQLGAANNNLLFARSKLVVGVVLFFSAQIGILTAFRSGAPPVDSVPEPKIEITSTAVPAPGAMFAPDLDQSSTLAPSFATMPAAPNPALPAAPTPDTMSVPGMAPGFNQGTPAMTAEYPANEPYYGGAYPPAQPIERMARMPDQRPNVGAPGVPNAPQNAPYPSGIGAARLEGNILPQSMGTQR